MKSKKAIFILAAMILLVLSSFLIVMSLNQEQVLEVEKLFIFDGASTLSEKADTSISELNKYKRTEISDTASLTLINSFKVTENKMYLWKGYWHGIIVFKDKSMHIIRISRYGGFFRDTKSKKIFQIEPNSKIDEWQNLINPMSDN